MNVDHSKKLLRTEALHTEFRFTHRPSLKSFSTEELLHTETRGSFCTEKKSLHKGVSTHTSYIQAHLHTEALTRRIRGLDTEGLLHIKAFIQV